MMPYSLVSGAVSNSSYKLATTVKDGGGYLVKTKSWVQDKDAAGNKIPGQGNTLEQNVAVDYLTARAFLSKDGKTIYIPFINKSQAQRDVKIKLLGKKIDGETMEILSISGALQDQNTFARPFKVTPQSTKVKAGQVISLPGYSTGVVKLNIK